MQDDLPSARRAGGDILRAVIQVENLRAAVCGLAFDDFVKSGIRLHGTVLV